MTADQSRKSHLREEIYPPLPDWDGEAVLPAQDGRAWRKACDRCAFRWTTAEHESTGMSKDEIVGRFDPLEDDTIFYCTHRTDGGHNRVCACYAACRAGAGIKPQTGGAA